MEYCFRVDGKYVYIDDKIIIFTLSDTDDIEFEVEEKIEKIEEK